MMLYAVLCIKYEFLFYLFTPLHAQSDAKSQLHTANCRLKEILCNSLLFFR